MDPPRSYCNWVPAPNPNGARASVFLICTPKAWSPPPRLWHLSLPDCSEQPQEGTGMWKPCIPDAILPHDFFQMQLDIHAAWSLVAQNVLKTWYRAHLIFKGNVYLEETVLKQDLIINSLEKTNKHIIKKRNKINIEK